LDLRPFMRHYAHAKREHAITSLDALLFELFALSYLLDPVIPRLLFRATAQLQFARPRDLDRSLRFMFIYCSLVNVGPVLRHVLPSFHYETQGLLLDFIGRSTPPARLHLVCLDIGIFLLQTLCLFIAHEAHGTSEQDELACVLESLPDDSSGSRIEEGGSPHKLSDNAPILHLRLNQSLRKIYHPPSEPRPLSDASNLPLPSTAQRTNAIASNASPVSRLVSMVQGGYESARQQRPSRESGAEPRYGETRTSSMPGSMVGL